MKLKKIASLALAGLMAVGMLAGCGEAASSTPTQNPTASNSLTNSVITELNKDEHMKELGVKAGDDAALETALKNVIDNYANDSLTAYGSFLYDLGTVNLDDVALSSVSPLLGKLKVATDADYTALVNLVNKDVALKVGRTDKAVRLFAINASVTDTDIAEQVAEKVTNAMSNADVYKTSDTYGSENDGTQYDVVYNYTVSVVTVVDSLDYSFALTNADVKYVAVMTTVTPVMDI